MCDYCKFRKDVYKLLDKYNLTFGIGSFINELDNLDCNLNDLRIKYEKHKKNKSIVNI